MHCQTRPLPPFSRTLSMMSGRLALNSVNPSTLPSRMGSQLALRMPYEMPNKPPPNVSDCANGTIHGGKSICLTTCRQQLPSNSFYDVAVYTMAIHSTAYGTPKVLKGLRFDPTSRPGHWTSRQCKHKTPSTHVVQIRNEHWQPIFACPSLQHGQHCLHWT